MFERLGLSSRQEKIYRTLVAEPNLRRNSIAVRAGVTEEGIDDDLEHLISLGLMRPDPVNKGYSLSDPEAALYLLIQQQQAHLSQLEDEARQLSQQLRRQRQAMDVNSIIEVVSGAEDITNRWERAQTSATQLVRMTDRPPYYDVKVEKMSVQIQRMQQGLSYRTLYDSQIFDNQQHLDRARLAVERGEEARVMPGVPIKLAIVDDEVAFLVLIDSHHTREPTVILVHRSALLDSLVALFDLLWARGVQMPVGRKPSAEDGVEAEFQTIVALLATGLKDDAVAAELGVAPRTIRRKMQALYDTLGVQNRFQAGIAVNSRGWV